jgi:hypothetical protein
MSEVEPASRSRLRAVGFLFATLGGLLAGIATMLMWIEESQELPDVLRPTFLGIDLPDGKVVLALSVVIIIASLVSRKGGGSTPRRGAAVLVVVAAFITIGIAGAALVTASSRFKPTVGVGLGIWLALAGGVIALAGGVMTLAWATAQMPVSDPDRAPD